MKNLKTSINSKTISSPSDNSSKSLPNPKSPIGVLDSGVGGLSVLREIALHLPFENLIYFGDTLNLPYGNKSKEALLRYCLANGTFLMEKGIKLLVVACHTASTWILEELQERFPIPIIGVAKCAIKPLLESTTSNTVAILGTLGTISSQIHASYILAARPSVKIHPIACPLFVPLVEEGLIDHPATELIVQHYLEPLKNHPVDAILLGCTHYPLLKKVIQKVVGPKIHLIEPAKECSEEIQTLLSSLNLLNSNTSSSHEFYVSDNPEKFRTLGSLFFGSKIDKVKLKV